METRSDSSPRSGTAPGSEQNSVFGSPSGIQHDVNDLIDALSLLGVKRCSECKRFFRSTEPGALFDYGKLVCFGCIPDWWSSQSGQLAIVDREKIESKLSSWLRKHHAAVAKPAPEKSAAVSEHEFQIVTGCFECRGSGKLMQGEPCRFCNGLGTVRMVVPR